MTAHTWGQPVATPETIVEKEGQFELVIERTKYTRTCTNCGAIARSFAEEGPIFCAFMDCESCIEASKEP